ncbi:MAG: cytochrome C oxidase subunit IV family protein [Planctomycetota bacterium]
MSDQSTNTDGHGHDDHHGDYHVVPIKYLVATGVALLFLTFITVAASWIDFGDYDLVELNIILAMIIAIVKASLVCLFFMHLRWDRPFNSFVLVSSIVFVGLFIMFSYIDTSESMPGVDEYRRVHLQDKEDQKVQAQIDLAMAKMDATEAGEVDHDGDDHGGDDHGGE